MTRQFLMKQNSVFTHQQEKSTLIAGVDEAGRGPLCGSVVAAAVILDPNKPIEGLNDSKKLSEKKREMLAGIIKSSALSFAISEASVEEIDQLNILQATMLAMKRAINTLTIQPEQVLIDGNRAPAIGIPCKTIIKGDSKIASISAASILAKVYRDHQMFHLDKLWPTYGFAKHKGYGTKHHIEAINKYGPCPAHRKSFKPVSFFLTKYS